MVISKFISKSPKAIVQDAIENLYTEHLPLEFVDYNIDQVYQFHELPTSKQEEFLNQANMIFNNIQTHELMGMLQENKYSFTGLDFEEVS